MAIGTTNVSMQAIAQEMDRAYAPGSNLSLKDLSQKHWKGGPTSYASFPEVRYYGSNCQFSTVVAAQGSGLAGMNAAEYGMGEWRGYTRSFNASRGWQSTIGRSGQTSATGTDGNGEQVGFGGGNFILTSVVSHAYSDVFDESSNFEWGTVGSDCGFAIWTEKDTSANEVLIKLADQDGHWNTGGSDAAAQIGILGPNDGSGQTTTNNTAYPSGFGTSGITLMKMTGASRITGCKMSLESGLPQNPSDDASVYDADNSGQFYSGIKVTTVGHNATGYPSGYATNTVNLGSTKIGYDLCMGGQHWFPESGDTEGNALFGVEFNYYATQNDGVVLDSNSVSPAGPTGFQSHRVTVYVSLVANAEHSFDEE